MMVRSLGCRLNLGLMLAALGSALPAFAQGKLELVKALPLDGPEFIQPSGLAVVGKTLVLVSAADDDQIYKVETKDDKAVYSPFLKLRFPKEAAGMKFAWRGMNLDKDGNFLLISEKACRIVKVTPGGDAAWEGPGLLEAGAEKGLFAGENSGSEGIVALGKKQYLVAAAREPRGLMQVDLSGAKPVVNAFVLDQTKIPMPSGRRHPDFSDLAQDKDQLWVLSANADAISKLKWNGQEYSEGEYWTFGHVSNDAKYRFMGLKMGLARGLAMDDQSVYVVLDNKGVARQSDPSDKRPLLLIFKRPH